VSGFFPGNYVEKVTNTSKKTKPVVPKRKKIKKVNNI